MKCLVTGATGFIGQQLCSSLRRRGDEVLPLSCSGAALADGTATVGVDLNGDIPAQLLQGIDVVFHLAGIAHQRAAAASYNALNYEATLKLARLACEAGVGRFIFLSSVKAMGESLSDAPRSEEETRIPVDAYGLSKWRAECALRKEFCTGNMALTIVRPALVYGKDAKGNLRRLAQGVRLGMPRPPAGGRRSMIAIEDLAALLCLLADNSGQGVQTWIASTEAHSTREIYDLMRRAMSKSPGVAWLPPWGWRLAAWAMDVPARNRDDSSFDKLFAAQLYDGSAVMEHNAWRPRCNLADVAGSLWKGGQR